MLFTKYFDFKEELKNVIHNKRSSYYNTTILDIYDSDELTKKEKLLNNVLRNYFFPTQACPTPTWDQAIYHYHSADDRLEFLWVIPSKDTCELFQENALYIVPEEKELLRFVLDFEDGTLLRLAKKLNKEGE